MNLQVLPCKFCPASPDLQVLTCESGASVTPESGAWRDGENIKAVGRAALLLFLLVPPKVT